MRYTDVFTSTLFYYTCNTTIYWIPIILFPHPIYILELAQLKQEDPLPLRKAKVTQEAALRKVEKERKAAEAATAALEEQTRNVEVIITTIMRSSRNSIQLFYYSIIQ